MPAVAQLVLQNKAHQFLRRRRHILKALTEGHHGKSVVLKRLYHHGGVPSVMGDLPDVIPLTQLADELLDKSIVDDVALRGMDIAAFRPLVIRHMIAPNAQGKRFLRKPEEGHDP